MADTPEIRTTATRAREARRWLQQASEWLELRTFAKWVGLAAIIGVAAGIAAVVFRWMITNATTHLFRAATGVAHDGVAGVQGRWWLVLFVPAAGGLLVGWLIQRFAPEAEGHGTDSVIRAYHRMKGVVRSRVIVMKSLTSALTIGTGGSAGQEGPVAQVGAGVGSSIATALGFSDRDRRLFLTAGGSAGVGAMFCSPLGGALFMPEVLYRKPEFEGEALVPCIVASTVAYATFVAISGEHRAVHIDPERLAALQFGGLSEIIPYLALGITCAVFGWIYVKVFYGVEALFKRLVSIPKWTRPGIGGLLVGALALALAPITGDFGVLFGGYHLMEASVANQLTVGTALLLVLAKIAATSLTISSGGSGGVFAPALAIGALIGAAVGRAAEALMPGLDLQPEAFALVGMGGFFAGVAKVPIASVVMVSEMTGSYALLAPLMLVSVVHVLLSGRWSLYQAQVGSPIDSPAHTGEYVIDVLQSVRVSDVVDPAKSSARLVNEDITLRAALKIVSESHETHFPVVDDDERLVGIFSLTDVRRIFLEDGIGNFVIVRDFMREQVATVRMDDTLHDVLRLFTRRAVSALPVVDPDDPRKVIAMLRRNDIGRAYSDRLKALKEG
ncbi:MAG: chloride channel protein [Planctomycetota bacterium]